MLYDGFVISFGFTRPEGIELRVLDSPSGQCSGQFQLPSLLELTQSLLPDLRGLRAELLPGPLSFRQIGDELFRSVFSGDVRTLFELSLKRVEDSHHGLQIKLILDPLDEDTAQLRSLPWKLCIARKLKIFSPLTVTLR
jgi:hypothetical protein